MGHRIGGVCVITAAGLVEGRRHQDVARAAVLAGVPLLQLRDKAASKRDFYELAVDLRRITRGTHTWLIINDHVDVALAVGADGVHLGDQDLPLDAARRLLGPEVILGASVATEEEVREAEKAGADYLGVGPIFPTSTKADAGEAVGLEQVRRFRALTRLPIIAIGGISDQNAGAVGAAGAAGIAVVSAVSGAADPIDAIRRLDAAFARGQASA